MLKVSIPCVLQGPSANTYNASRLTGDVRTVSENKTDGAFECDARVQADTHQQIVCCKEDECSREQDNNADNLESKQLLKIYQNQCNVGQEDEQARESGNGNKFIAPDGGWGWFIVLGVFMNHFVLGGFLKSNGVVYLQLLERFQRSATATSWVLALFSTITLVMAPLASALCSKFSIRFVVYLGATMTTIGVLISMFSPNLGFMYFSYGILTGLGRSLVNSPGLVMVGHYFNKRLGLAVGLASCGGAFGTFIFPPMFEKLFDFYGFSGAFLVLAAINSHIFVSGALLRSLELQGKLTDYDRKRKEQRQQSCQMKAPNLIHLDNTGIYQQLLSTSTKPTSELTTSTQSTEESPSELTTSELTTSTQSTEESPSELTTSELTTSTQSTEESQYELTTSTKSTDESPAKLSFIKRKLSEIKLAIKVAAPDSRNTTTKKMLELSLFKNYAFLTLCLQLLMFNMSFGITFVFLPALTQAKGLTKIESAYLISIIGLSDVLSRALISVILDLKKVKKFRLVIYNILMLLLGVISEIIPLMRTFRQFSIICAVYGIMSGTCFSQRSVVVVDILGVEKLQSSFGLLLLFQGIGSLIGPVVGALLKDIVGSYDTAFYFGSTGLIVGAIALASGNSWLYIQRRQCSLHANA